LGPFIEASTGEVKQLAVSENRAAMCLFVAHFVLRMHQRMYEAANADRLMTLATSTGTSTATSFPAQPEVTWS
jgi:hypothetical protein